MEDPLKLMSQPPEEITVEVIEVEEEVDSEVDSVEEEDKEEVDSVVEEEAPWEEEEEEFSFLIMIRLLKRDLLFLSRDPRSSFEIKPIPELYIKNTLPFFSKKLFLFNNIFNCKLYLFSTFII